MAPRSVSPWRRFWRNNEGAVYITIGVFSTVLVAGLVIWAIRATSDFYASDASTAPSSQRSTPPATPRFDWRFASPVRLDFEISKLVYGNNVIVSRDISKLIGDRLEAAGFELSDDSDRVIRVKYREREAEIEIPIRPESDAIENPFDGTIRPIQIDLTVFISSPQYGEATVLQRALISDLKEVIIPINSAKRSYGQYQRDLYTDAYAKFLDQLRVMQLPKKSE